MIAIIQRVSEAAVTIEKQVNGNIQKGFMILLGITHNDQQEDIDWLSKKITGLRIFDDDDGKMNLSIKDVSGDILLISQFTLLANTKKGNRPSYIEAARPEVAIPLYQKMITSLENQLHKKIETGIFGAEMQVNIINDGPVTIVIDTKNKK